MSYIKHKNIQEYSKSMGIGQIFKNLNYKIDKLTKMTWKKAQSLSQNAWGKF